MNNTMRKTIIYLSLIVITLTAFFGIKAAYKKRIKHTVAIERAQAKHVLDSAIDELNTKHEKAALEGLVRKLKIYDIYDQNGLMKLVRHGREYNGGYVVPEIAFEKADALIGYGIDDDISFEEQFSNIYNKPSYGFDCGVESIEIKNKLCSFISECISSDSSLYKTQKSSNKISSFTEQIKRLGLKDKKLFIKMDIEGAEYEAFQDIYKYAPNITGIVLEIHFWTVEQTIKALGLISRLSDDFLLVHVHGCNFPIGNFTTKLSKGEISRALELTFINKALVSRYNISLNQTHPTIMDSPNKKDEEDVKFEILRDDI